MALVNPGKVVLSAAVLFWLSFIPASCSNQEQRYRPDFRSVAPEQKQLVLGLPSLNLYESCAGLVRYLTAHMNGIGIRTVACTSIEDYEAKLKRGYFDFTVVNGFQLLIAEASGYAVVGRISGEYRAVIFANKDSSIHNFSDLKGRTFCLTDNRILGGAVMPLIYLYDHGVDVNRSIRRLYTPSFESVMMNVSLGKASAGGSWSVFYDQFAKQQPGLASRLEVKWITPSLPSSALLFKREMDKGVAQKLASLLFHLGDDEAGRRALAEIGIGSLEATDSTCYDPMKAVLRKFDSCIH